MSKTIQDTQEIHRELPIQLNGGVNATYFGDDAVITNCGFNDSLGGLKTVAHSIPQDIAELPNKRKIIGSIMARYHSSDSFNIQYYLTTEEVDGEPTKQKLSIWEEDVHSGTPKDSVVVSKSAVVTNLEIYNHNGKRYIVFGVVNILHRFDITARAFDTTENLGVLSTILFFDNQRDILWILDKVNNIITGFKDGAVYEVGGVQFIIRLQKDIRWFNIFNQGTNIYAIGMNPDTGRIKIIGHKGLINENVFYSEEFPEDLVDLLFLDGKLYILASDGCAGDDGVNDYYISYFNGRGLVRLTKNVKTTMSLGTISNASGLTTERSWRRRSFILRGYNKNGLGRKERSQLMEFKIDGTLRGLTWLSNGGEEHAYNTVNLLQDGTKIYMYYMVFDHTTNTEQLKYMLASTCNTTGNQNEVSVFEIGPLHVPYQKYWVHQFKISAIFAGMEEQLAVGDFIKISVARNWKDQDWRLIKTIEKGTKREGDSKDDTYRNLQLDKNHKYIAKLYLKIEVKGDVWLKNLFFKANILDELKF